MADQVLKGVFNKVNGSSVRYKASPVLGGAGVGGVSLTAGAGSWGAFADTIAAAAIATEFWVCGSGQYTLSGIQNFQLECQNTTLTSSLYVYSCDVTATTLNAMPFMVQFPIYCAAGNNIQMRAGGAAAKSIVVYQIYAIGL